MVFLGCNLHLLKTSFTDITVISVTSTEDYNVPNDIQHSLTCEY